MGLCGSRISLKMAAYLDRRLEIRTVFMGGKIMLNVTLDEIYDALDDLGIEPTQRISTLIQALDDDESLEDGEDDDSED
jgi:hypothetical protein